MPVVGGDRVNIRSWDIVKVYVAPVGTAVPTDVATALNALFIYLGLMSEDEYVTSRAEDRNELRSMGGDLVRTKVTGQTRSFAFTALENTDQVFKAANPGSTSATVTTITTRSYKKRTALEQAVVVQHEEGSLIMRQIYLRAELFSDGDRQAGPSGMWGTPITGMVYPDSAGLLYTEITNDPAAITP